MSIRSRVLLGLATAAGGVLSLALTFGACDQGEGERCQRTEDCESPLTCNLGTQLCQIGAGSGVVTGIDAPNDADLIDGPVDAGTDATIDAVIDAPPAALP